MHYPETPTPRLKRHEHLNFSLLFLLSFLVLICPGCVSAPESTKAEEPDVYDLANSGKADVMLLDFTLTDEGPTINLRLGCDQPYGCDGYIQVYVMNPSPCEILVSDPQECFPGMDPVDATVAMLNLHSETEGERELDLRVETGDGSFFARSISASFTAEAHETVSFALTKTSATSTLEVEIFAEWHAIERQVAEALELERFLSSIEGLTFYEIGTQYPGYRAYHLTYTQPLDHNEPDGETFQQSIMLHHWDRNAPMMLYTSGYELFVYDYLTELAELLPANQISTEQRFFGTSLPSDVSAESWKHVNIEQAANDHHRIVEALRPFYWGTWISTGYSKGGMTSIYHRRFFPYDVDATVAYVAPISFGAPDPRYEDFLDQIGTNDCREAVRSLQRAAFERFDVLQPRAEADALMWGLTFNRTGGHAAAFEYAITALDWSFWQSRGIEYCWEIPSVEGMSDEALYYEIVNRVGYGDSDDICESTYRYQAMTELGFQSFSTRVFEDILPHGGVPRFCAPAIANASYNPDVMVDIQDWLLQEGREIIFVYGQYDPWTGGRFSTTPSEWIVDVTAPETNHGASLRDLFPADQKIVLDAIENWIGLRPTIPADWQPSYAPLPPRLLYHGLPRPFVPPR